MDLRLLRFFVACVEHKTMHAAAEAVNVSQPALSKAIRNLEAELGVKLLDRQPRGVVPTPYGDTLFRYAKMIDSELRHAIAEIDAMRGMTRGTIVIGVIPTMSGLFAEVAREVIERHPRLKLKVRVGFSAELSPALLEGEIDLALLLLPENGATIGLAFTSLIRTGPVVVVRKGHPLAGRTGLSLRELADYPWLIPDYPPSHRAVVYRAFMDAGIPPPVSVIDVSTVIFFDSLIRDSNLVTVAPATLLSASQRAIDLVALETEFQFPIEQVGMAYRENSTLLPGARVVMDLVRARCAKLPGHVPASENGKRRR
jgi:DNA-binding transcriptional LysR family regulator